LRALGPLMFDVAVCKDTPSAPAVKTGAGPVWLKQGSGQGDGQGGVEAWRGLAAERPGQARGRVQIARAGVQILHGRVQKPARSPCRSPLA